jgi:hypothetical protein
MIPKTVFVAGGSFKMGMGSLVESERPAHPVNSILTRYRFISGLNLFSEELFLHLFRHKGIEC